MRITTGNWVYNAGIVGFLRILNDKGLSYSDVIKDSAIVITPKLLEGFGDAYFKRALKNQCETLLTIKDQNKIREIFKKELGVDLVSIKDQYLSQIKVITISGKSFNEYSKELIIVIDRYFSELLGIIENSGSKNTRSLETIKKKIDEAKKSKLDGVRNHNVFSNYFGNFYFNKSVLCNPKGKIDRIDGFNNKYVADATKTLKNQNRSGTVCRFCNQNKIEIKAKESKDLPVFNEGLFSISGISIDKFKNFFYNAIPDLFICNVCELIMLCSFAGLNRKPRQLANSDKTDYIFVNMPSLELLLRENDALQGFYENFTSAIKDTVYEHVLKDIILKAQSKKSQWALQNIFFVELKTSARKDAGKPVFKYFHVGKDIAELFVNESNTISKIRGRLNLQKDAWIDLKTECIKLLLEGDNLYPLAGKNLKEALSNGKAHAYNSFVLAYLQAAKKQINLSYIKGGNSMDSKKVYGILAQQFFNRGKEDFNDLREWPIDKKQRLSYRLLSLVRMGKYAEFYETLMKLYINLGKPMPESFLGLLNTHDTIDFEAKAYAFMTGFLQDSSQSAQLLNNNKEGQDE